MSVLMIVPTVCGLIYHDPERFVNSFIISGIITFLSGLILISLFKRKQITNLSLKGSLIFVLGIWGIIAIYSGLPYLISGELGVFDSFFEAMSGITTTGFSLIPVQTHPYSVAMWKALTQWFGGLGIIVLLLVIVPSSVSLKRLFFAEGRTEQMTPNVRHTTMIFLKLYLILTSFGVILYLILGLNLFESICFTFTAFATGGYSIYAADAHIFDSLPIQLVTMFLMILGSTNFVIHYRILKGNTKNLFKDVELRAMLIIVTVATLLVMLSLYTQGYYNLRNKILITQNSLKEYLMFETNDIQHNGQINNMTKLQYKQRVDLVILNNFNKTPNMDSLIDKDTIITKNLGDNIFYIEDLRNDLYIIITEKERLVIEGRGAKTQLKYHETKIS